MVSIGSLSWTVEVQNAAKAKKSAEDVEESVKGAKESMEEADEQTGGLKEKLGGLSDIQEKAGAGFDKMNAKAGFFGTALSFVVGTISTLLGILFSLKALLLGGLIAAIVGLAIAWKENVGDIQGRVEGFKEFIFEQFNAIHESALKIWNRFLAGFKSGGGDIKDLKTLFIAYLDGIEAGLKAFWNMFQPLWSGFVDIIIWAAGPIGKFFGMYYNALAEMERESQTITKIVAWVTALVATFATAWAIVSVLTSIGGAIMAVVTAIAPAIGALSGLIATFTSYAGILALVKGVIMTVVGILGGPLTIAILAITAIAVALYAAWKTNFLGIRDITDDVINKAMDLFDSLMNKAGEAMNFIRELFSGDIGQNLAQAFRGAFNSIIPDNINIPSITIGGGSIAGKDIPSATIGGGSLDIPQLQSGGYIEQGGMAQLHAGEAVIPADVTRPSGGNDMGEGMGMTKIEVNVGGVEIGDQTLDIRNMSRTELTRLAQEIAKALGDDVRNVVS